MDLVLRVVAVTLRLTARISTRLAGKVAFALFGRPIRAKVRAAELDVHLAARTKTIVVNGKNIAVYWWGDGQEPVLLVPGWGGRGSNYAGFVPQLLGRGLGAVTFDAPGHGDSEGKTTDLVECAQIIRDIERDHGPFHAVIAHSFGVLSAFHAVRSGTKAGRLVAINGVCEIGYLIDGFCRQLGLPAGVRNDMRRRMEEHFAPETDIWRKFCASFDPAAFGMPILVIQDEDDDTVDVEQARRLAAAHVPRSTLMITKGLGHRKIMAAAAVFESAVEFVVDGKLTTVDREGQQHAQTDAESDRGRS